MMMEYFTGPATLPTTVAISFPYLLGHKIIEGLDQIRSAGLLALGFFE
jgi:hypothetical protein